MTKDLIKIIHEIIKMLNEAHESGISGFNCQLFAGQITAALLNAQERADA